MFGKIDIKRVVEYWDGPIIRLTLLILALGLFGFYSFIITAFFILLWNIRDFYINIDKLPRKLYCYRKNHMYYGGVYCSICGCHKNDEFESSDPDDITKIYKSGY